MKRTPLTIEDHRSLAALLRDPRIIRASCDIPNHCGTSSRAGKLARRIYDLTSELKSELEMRLATDHPAADHTGIYYLTENK